MNWEIKEGYRGGDGGMADTPKDAILKDEMCKRRKNRIAWE